MVRVSRDMSCHQVDDWFGVSVAILPCVPVTRIKKKGERDKQVICLTSWVSIIGGDSGARVEIKEAKRSHCCCCCCVGVNELRLIMPRAGPSKLVLLKQQI